MYSADSDYIADFPLFPERSERNFFRGVMASPRMLSSHADTISCKGDGSARWFTGKDEEK